METLEKNGMMYGVLLVIIIAIGWAIYRFANVPESDWNEDIPSNPMQDDSSAEAGTNKLSVPPQMTSDIEEGNNKE